MCLKFILNKGVFRKIGVRFSKVLKNISKYIRFVKELALYQNDNYMGSYENALIYNGCSTQDYRDRRGNPMQLRILKREFGARI